MSQISVTINLVESDYHQKLSPETHQILRSFFSQVVNQPVKFTAAGFYTINLPLLASIITGVVSYQIILIQFHAS